MDLRFKSLSRALLLASAVALPSVAMSQPLAVTVNPFALPEQIVRAPFEFLLPAPTTTYNPAPAQAAAVRYTDELYAVVPVPVLRQTGPQYVNPIYPARTTVIRRGSYVPATVETAPAENISLAGLAPEGRYEFFVSPERKIVFLDPASRRVVRIVR